MDTGNTVTVTAAGTPAVVSMLIGFGIAAAALGILMIIAMWRVFTKAGRPGWAAIIPFYNTYILLRLVGRPGWWLLLMLIPGVNMVIIIMTMLDLAKSFGKSALFGVFGLVIFGFVGLFVLGFGDARYLGPANGTPSQGLPQQSAYGY